MSMRKRKQLTVCGEPCRVVRSNLMAKDWILREIGQTRYLGAAAADLHPLS